MEALEKDFSDLVASEDTVETDTDQVTAEAGVEDIVQQILSANADQSVDEPTVAEEEAVEEEIAEEEETVDEVETEEILEEEDAEEDIELELALADEDGWEDVAEEDLAEMEAYLAELKEDNPDIDFDNADIVMHEDGSIEVINEIIRKIFRKLTGKDRIDADKRNKQAAKDYASNKGGVRTKAKKSAKKRKGKKKTFSIKRQSFDPSEVAADDAVAIGEEEDQEIDEYTVGSQTRPTNATVWRTVGGTLKKVKRWTSKGKKGINKGPKSAGHKTAISKAMKRVWKAGGARRKAQGGASEESYDPTNDVSALLTGEELSEEFKEKASTIFEAAVNNEVDKQLALAEAEVHAVFDTAIDDAKTELTEQLDNYFDYVTDQWFEDNQVAIDTGIRSEIAENFISGLKTLFTENYVEVPESKTDVLQELGKQLVELKSSLNEQITSNVSLKQELSELKRHEVVQSLSSDLTVTEVEKLKELSAGISFEDSSDFVSKVETIKENYFPSKTVKPVQQEEEQEESFEVLSESMDIYSNALTRLTQR